MNFRPYSSTVLTLGGILLAGLGLYFVLARPALLPEDLHYMGTTLGQVQSALPSLLVWLPRVFWVMGGFMLSSGILTVHVARTTFRRRESGAAGIVALTGAASIGWMAVVNFMINSEFKGPILAFAVLWPIALVLYRIERNQL